MKKITFEFLETMPLKEIDKSPISGVLGGKTPAGDADFRLFSDGTIYPSENLIKLANLEFQKKGSGIEENGYDVFLSTDWDQYSGTVKFPCIALVSKHLKKVDLFSRTKHADDGTPKSSVRNLKSTQGEGLIKILEQCYCENNESIFNNTFIDLKINTQHPVQQTNNKIYNIPKKILKGKDAGKPDYVRRENIIIYPLEIVENNNIIEKKTVNSTVTSLGASANAINKTPLPANHAEVPPDILNKVFGN